MEESEKSDLAAAAERHEMLQQYFGNKVGLIHGKMKETEKDAVMEEFKIRNQNAFSSDDSH